MTAVATVSVSVLNATYEVLGTTKLDRALALVLSNRAEIEEADPLRRVRHKNGWHPWPKVIRMLKYIKVPMRYAPAAWTKAGVLKRDGHKCGYCTKRAGTTVDHIQPQSRGGGNTWENTIACCQPCNAKKDDKTPKEANMPLLFQPSVPMRVYISAKK